MKSDARVFQMGLFYHPTMSLYPWIDFYTWRISDVPRSAGRVKGTVYLTPLSLPVSHLHRLRCEQGPAALPSLQTGEPASVA